MTRTAADIRGSQSRTDSSADPLASKLPRGDQSSASTAAVWPARGAQAGAAVAADHSRRRASSPPVASSAPSSDQATSQSPPVCPLKTASAVGDVMFKALPADGAHSPTGARTAVQSADAVATSMPSGEKRAAAIAPAWCLCSQASSYEALMATAVYRYTARLLRAILHTWAKIPPPPPHQAELLAPAASMFMHFAN